MRIPRATYRLQFSPSFGFSSAKEVIPYLADLGISHLYASPIFKARKGSLHGYDVVDPNLLNPELGTESEFTALIETVKAHHMGWLQDIVPNHMAFAFENRILVDVLENGPSSQYFHFFDIDWDHPYESIKGRVLAPFLGRPYGEVLEGGELTLRYQQNGFAVDYYDMAFPLSIKSYARVLTHQLGGLRAKLGSDHPDFINLLGILYVLQTLESRDLASERYDQITFIKRMLWELYSRNEEIRRFIEENTRVLTGRKGDPESFVHLDELLYEQFFRLSFWKVATEEINYRRFFNLNNLICLKVEDEDVFNHAHALIFQLIDSEKITGLRVDHVDGLYDPAEYLERLREKCKDTYVVVEKILGLEEGLPPSWPVQGTTGYDFMNYVNGLFCSGRHERAMNRIYSNFTSLKTPFGQVLLEKKRLIIEKHMGGDVDNLALLLKSVSARDRYGRDITLYGLRKALVEVLASFPVYRTYIRKRVISEKDSEYIEVAVRKAVQNSPGLVKELHFIRRFLLLELPDYMSEEEETHWIDFLMRFQQLTGPLMAKGLEDTTLYVYNRLLSLNEVGGDPSKFGVPLEAFHQFIEHRSQVWPHSLNTTSTHDIKRGEDVRARIHVLSEISEEWGRRLRFWSKMNRSRRKKVHGLAVPDRNDEYFLYQTLLGVFPCNGIVDEPFISRIKEHVIKAVREAKVHTAWLQADTAYEEAYLSFIEKILDPDPGNAFMKEFMPFAHKVAHFGLLNALSQTLVKTTCPGVPDFYQGTELWDLNLVDPDNRRPVGFEKRKTMLKDIHARVGDDTLKLIDELLSAKDDGRLKLFLIYKVLKARIRSPGLFQQGRYIPLDTTGRLRGHIIAFARSQEKEWALTIAPRFLTDLIEEGEYPLGTKTWQDTRVVLPPGVPGTWTDAITDRVVKAEERLPIGDALKFFPISLLIGRENPS
jgi:(1->4)-alpha-D-glucan 1-alpha-D-glucosylmutase